MSIDSTLLACILFICVECLRGDWQLAMRHYYAGMAIALDASQNNNSSHQPLQASGLRQQLLRFFNRLELLSQLFGHRPAYEYCVEPLRAVPTEFASIVEARDSIVHLMNLSLRFIHSKTPRRSRAKIITSQDYAYRSILLGSLQVWQQALSHFLETNPQNPHLTQPATILQLHQIVTTTWLNRCLSPSETATDADIPLYQRAVSLAETLQPQTQNQNQPPSCPSTFLLDMQTISPLYLLALKCRHAPTRRRAIALLRRSVRREGLWDSQKAAAVAARVVELEEEGLWPKDGSVLPGEEKRVWNVRVVDEGPGLGPMEFRVVFTRGAGRWVEGLRVGR